jgi:hypothetical protein
MSGNNNPVYSKVGDVQSGAGVVIGPSANTAQDGTGANTYMVFQADTTNGGLLQKLIARTIGSPAATVMRIYICTVTGAFTPGTSNTAATTYLIDEITLPAQTLSQVAAAIGFQVAMNLMMPPGYRILVSFGTSTGAAGTGYVVTGVGGKY